MGAQRTRDTIVPTQPRQDVGPLSLAHNQPMSRAVKFSSATGPTKQKRSAHQRTQERVVLDRREFLGESGKAEHMARTHLDQVND